MAAYLTLNVNQHTQVHLGQGPKKIKSVPDITGSKNRILFLLANTIAVILGSECFRTHGCILLCQIQASSNPDQAHVLIRMK
jgi:hypothetical protein